MNKQYTFDREEFLQQEALEQEIAEKIGNKQLEKIPSRLKQHILYIITPIATLQPVKIGITLTPRYRLHQLQVGNWNRLEIYKMFQIGPHAYVLEQHIHRHLASKSLGGEWFDLTAGETDRIVQEYVKENINYFKEG